MIWRRRVVPDGDVDWPVRRTGLTPLGASITIRSLTPDDAQAFAAVRRANAAWFAPWDATSPVGTRPVKDFAELVAFYDREALEGRAAPFAVEFEGRFVGQLNLNSITLGSFRSCSAGYWVSRSVAGRWVIPTALALAGDYAFEVRELHRLEVNIRPENTASLAVVRKLGFRDEGMRPRLLHIDGDWRDHRSFALTTEDLGAETFLDRLHRLSQQSLWRHTEAGPPA